jgi:hypothetical protein
MDVVGAHNAPEFIAPALRRWHGQVGVDAMRIESGVLGGATKRVCAVVVPVVGSAVQFKRRLQE